MIGGAPQSEHEARRRAEVREQRRYEIARDVMAGFATRQGFADYIGSLADEAILAADAILCRLEKSK